MGLLLISLVLGSLLGCALWLVIGDRLPPRRTEKWSALGNIVLYAGGIATSLYVLIFILV